jgi:hypothetical protein
LWGESLQECTYSFPGGFDGAFGGFAQQGFELGKDLFDWIEIGTVGRKEEQLGRCATAISAFMAY